MCIFAFEKFPLRLIVLVLCEHSLSVLVVAASLEWDLDDLVSHAYIKLAPAVQDQKASDRLSLPGREQLDLL